MDLYSVTLAASFVAAAAAVLGALLQRLAGTEGSLRRFIRGLSSRRSVRVCALAALLLLLVSVTDHFFFGHRPGSTDAMTPVQFAAEHPAFGLVALMSGLALLWSRNSKSA